MVYELEIFRDGEWHKLDLPNGQKVKYNLLVNDIGNPSERKISHSNTYTLPKTVNNIQALGLNYLNSNALRRSLNRKFDCRIKDRGRITMEGFLVINRPTDKDIKVNVIDKAVDLLGMWGSTTYKELLNNDALISSLPQAFRNAVAQLREFNIPLQNQPMTPTSNIYGLSYPLAAFPNTLNVIGDNFNKLDTDIRVPADRINTFQSRPLFNASAFLRMICNAYGYNISISPSNDPRNDYIVPESANEEPDTNQNPETGLLDDVKRWDIYDPGSSNTVGQMAFYLPPGVPSNSPNNITGYTDPPELLVENVPAYSRRDYKAMNCIYYISESRMSGKLTYFCNYQNVSTFPDNNCYVRHYVRSVWRNLNGLGVMFHEIEGIEDVWEWKSLSEVQSAEIVIDKSQFKIKPDPNAFTFFGILHIVQFRRPTAILYPEEYDSPHMINMRTTEEIITEDKITFNDKDEFYQGTTVNLANAAPQETIKNLLSGILVRNGLLCYIDDLNKTVYFYGYGLMTSRITSRTYIDDWSDYFLKNMPIEYDTQYGDKYAKLNRIGLKEAFPGNSYNLKLSEQGEDSKYKDFVEFENPQFKDVTEVKLVNTGGVKPYFEYTNKGLGLVSIESTINGLIQTNSKGVEAGTVNVRHAQNVNYHRLPQSVIDWYEIINKGVRVKGYFLLPQDVIKNIDLRRPKYVEGLNSTTIIEKVSEYVDAQTPVEVTLIIPGVIEP